MHVNNLSKIAKYRLIYYIRTTSDASTSLIILFLNYNFSLISIVFHTFYCRWMPLSSTVSGTIKIYHCVILAT